MIYVALLIFTVIIIQFVQYWDRKHLVDSYKDQKLRPPQEIAFVIISVSFVLVYAVRQDVGTDFSSYYMMYNVRLFSLHQWLKYEPLYSIINIAFHHFDAPFSYVLGALSVPAIATTIYIILRYSPYPVISILILFGMGFVFDITNHVRQTAAMGIFMLAIPCIWKEKPLKYILYIFLAAGFHYTALLMIPFYWMARLKTPTVVLLFLLFFSLLSYLYYPVRDIFYLPMTYLAPPNYEHYVDRVFQDSPRINSGLNVLSTFLIFFVLLVVAPHMPKSSNLQVRSLFLLSFYGAVGSIAFSTFWQIYRLPAYLILTWVLFFPTYIMLLRFKHERILVCFLVVLYFMIAFVWRMLAKSHQALPYNTIFG